MKRTFVKMQGLGNDFIIFDELAMVEGDKCVKMCPELAKRLCDRRFGIGADGVVILRNSENENASDITWEFYNSDGSLAEMCGNALRCVARFVYDRDLWPMPEPTIDPVVIVGDDGDLDVDTSEGENPPICCGELRVQTLAGIKPITLERCSEGSFLGARIDMGIAEVDSSVNIGNRKYARISMGNPHAVTFVDELPDQIGTAPVSDEGPIVEVDPAFPQKTNVEFAVVESRDTIRTRVWERGAGETLACGTGACATAVAAKLNGEVDEKVTVNLLGGPLTIEVEEDLRVFMTGPAQQVFTGSINLPCSDCGKSIDC